MLLLVSAIGGIFLFFFYKILIVLGIAAIRWILGRVWIFVIGGALDGIPLEDSLHSCNWRGSSQSSGVLGGSWQSFKILGLFRLMKDSLWGLFRVISQRAISG